MCVLSAVEVLSDMFDVEKAFSWIVSTSGFVSWIGLKLHHPNEKLQLTKEEARIFLQVVETKIERHKASLETLIANFTEANNTDLTQQSLNLKEAKNLQYHITRGRHHDTVTYDIEEHLRSLTYFANKKDKIFSTNEHISSDIRTKKPFSEHHLLPIRECWQLLRVQYNILKIQVQAAEINKPSSSKAQKELQGCEEGQERLFWSTEKPDYYTLKSCSQEQASWTSLSTMEEVNDFADERNVGLPRNWMNLNSPRDDGYYSRAGESAVDEAQSFTDSQSVETDLTASQEEPAEKFEKCVFMIPKRPVQSESEISNEVISCASSSLSDPNVFMVPKRPVPRNTKTSNDITLSPSTQNPNVFLIPKSSVFEKDKEANAGDKITKHHVTFSDPDANPENKDENANDLSSTSSSAKPEITPKNDYDGINCSFSPSSLKSKNKHTSEDNYKPTTDRFFSPFSTSVFPSKRRENVITEEWTELIRIVDRFSENTISLISWIDELNEVMHDESFSPKFFRSQSSRERNATHHVERLYDEVIEDAATLLRNLPSEREILIKVLRNIETQCCKVGIFVTDDVNELSSIKPTKCWTDRKSGCLSKELKNEIFPPVSVSEELRSLETASRGQTSLLRFYDHFKPQAVSTPKIVGKKRDHSDDTELRDYSKEVCLEEYDSLRRSLSGKGDEAKEWSKFFSEYQSALKHLHMIEEIINGAERNNNNSKRFFFQKHLRQLSRFEDYDVRDLKSYAKNLEEMCPNLQQKIRNKLSVLDDLLDSLHRRLIDYVAAPPSRRQFLESAINEISTQMLEPCDRFFDENDIYVDEYDRFLPIDCYYLYPYYRHRYPAVTRISDWDISEWRRLYPFFDHSIQLSDFSHHQIRDQLSLGKPGSRWNKRLSCEWRDRIFHKKPNSSETPSSFDEIDDRRASNSDLLHSSPISSNKPHWTEINRLESEHDRNLRSSDRYYSPFFIPRHTKSYQKPLSPPNALKKTLPNNSMEEIHDSMSKELSPFDFIEARMSPLEISDCIHSFNRWLKLIEEDAYESRGIGWKEERVKRLQDANQDRMIKLKEKNKRLERIVSASQKLLNNHGREVSEFCLMWAFWMLEQRYYNLVLHALDMDCILDRRSAVIHNVQKGMTEKIQHPPNDVWSDNGEDMRPTVETYDKDYDIFWPHYNFH